MGSKQILLFRSDIKCAGNGPLSEEVSAHLDVDHFGYLSTDELVREYRAARVFVVHQKPVGT